MVGICVILAILWFWFGWSVNELYHRHLRERRHEWTPLNKRGRFDD